MYSSKFTSTLKGFIYTVPVLLILCSALASAGHVFARFIPFPVDAICDKLMLAAVILLAVQMVSMLLVTIFQITRLRLYAGYFILSIISVATYLILWFDVINLFGKGTGVF